MASPLPGSRASVASEGREYEPAPAPDEARAVPLRILWNIGNSWRVTLYVGVLTILFGIVIAVVAATASHVLLAILVGTWLLVLGSVRIVTAVADDGADGGHRSATAFVGLLAILAGLVILHRSMETVGVLEIVLGLFLVVGGLAELLAALSPAAEGRRGPKVAMGLTSTLIGLACLVYPGLSFAALGVLLSVAIILWGAAEVALALRVRTLGAGRVPRAHAPQHLLRSADTRPAVSIVRVDGGVVDDPTTGHHDQATNGAPAHARPAGFGAPGEH